MSEVKSALRTATDKPINEEKTLSFPASGVVLTFKSEGLAELSDIARKMQDLLAALRPYCAYDLHALYDENTECWTGVLEEIF